MDSEATFQVGDRVKVVGVQHACADIKDMQSMIGETHYVKSASEISVFLDGWYFDNDVVELIERDGKPVGEDESNPQVNIEPACESLSRRELAKDLMLVDVALNGLGTTPRLVARGVVAYADALIAALDKGEGE